MARVESLAALPKRPGVVEVRFDGGVTLRVTLALAADFGLYAGLELTEAQLCELRSAVAEGEARAVALRLLTNRPHARRELVDKLCRRGIDPDAAEAAAEYLSALGYMDDAQYARTVAEHCAQRGYGRRRLEEELRRRGVDRADWPEPPEEKDETERAIDAFLQNKLKGRAPDEPERRRLAAALARRGFDWSDIYAGLRRAEAGESPPPLSF